MAPLNRRINVVFGISKYRRLGEFRNKVIGIKADIANYTAIFATPLPTVLQVNTDFTALDTAQALVETRAPNGVATRDAARKTVTDDMRAWQRYVQGLIDAETDPDQKLIIANSSGFDITVNGVRVKPDFKVIQMATPGTVKLVARSAGMRAAYSWQMSANNGSTWTDLPITNVANTSVAGLTLGARYVFRFRSVVKNVTSPWSFTVSVVMQINP